MLFRRFTEAFIPVQSKTSTFRETILYMAVLALWIILELKCQAHDLPKEEKKKIKNKK